MLRGEVAVLGLAGVDGRTGKITVRWKGNRAERLPLPLDVGEAIVAYVRDGRRRLLRTGRPSRASTRHITQTAAVADVTAYGLRHTAATELLRAGAPLMEIGQSLRHRT